MTARGELDTNRLQALAAQLGQSPVEVAATLHSELTRAFTELDAALAAGDDDAVGHAGHAARNSALMIAARPLLEGLRTIETLAGDGDLASARTAREALDEHWAAVAAALQAAS